MGGGDLNLKKSWHPLTLRNLEKVWLAEQAAEKEKQKVEQLRKERLQEQSLDELRSLNQGSTLKKSDTALSWMYSGMSNSSTNQGEDYLLGRKKPQNLSSEQRKNKVEPSNSNLSWKTQNSLSDRDLEAKAREDPLVFIKNKESVLAKNIIATKKYVHKLVSYKIRKTRDLLILALMNADDDFYDFNRKDGQVTKILSCQLLLADNYDLDLALALSKPVIPERKGPLRTSVKVPCEAMIEVQQRLLSIINRWS